MDLKPSETSKSSSHELISKTREKHQQDTRRKERLNLFQSKRFPPLGLTKFPEISSKLSSEDHSLLQIFEGRRFELSDYENLLALLLKKDKISTYCGLIGIRKLVSEVENYDFFPDMDISPLVTLLLNHSSDSSDAYAQFESLWVLSNLAGGEEELVDFLTSKGVLLALTQAMESQNEHVQAQAIWGIANIISEKRNLRESLVNIGVLDKLAKIWRECGKECKEIVIWAISNIFKMRPYLEWEAFLKIFDDLLGVLKEEKAASENLVNTLSVFYIYSKIYSDDVLKLALKDQFLEALIEILRKPEAMSEEIISTDLHILKNLARYSSIPLFDSSFFSLILGFLDSSKEIIRMGVIEILHEVIEGNNAIVESLISKSSLVTLIRKIYLYTSSKQEKGQLLIFFESLTRNCEFKDLLNLMDKGFLDFLVEILMFEEAYELLNSGLDCIRNFLESPNYVYDEIECDRRVFAKRFLQQNGASLLERLQLCKNDLIYEKSVSIIDDFFESK